MLKLYYPVLLVFYLITLFIFNARNFEIQYDLNDPDAVIELPSILKEVSGLTAIDNDYIACVQDEMGIIFIVDLKDGTIKDRYEFEPSGDFEGIAHVENTFYILRSDGRITILPDYRKPDEKINVKGNLLTKNNEGLCYDKKNNRLLIAAKSKPVKDSPQDRENRLFYQYNIENAELDTTPAFTIKISDIINFSKKRKLKLPVSDDEDEIDFRPSSIAIHPVSQLVYIISAKEYLLLVCDQQGNLIHLEKLDPEIYPQAEGITFLPDKTLIITNEADDNDPTLLKLKYKGL